MLVLQLEKSQSLFLSYLGLFKKFTQLDVFEIAKIKDDVEKLDRLQEFDFFTIWASSGQQTILSLYRD